MKELKLHSDGANRHLKSITDTFDSFKQKLKGNMDLSDKEKEIQLARARETFLEEKKQLRHKLF